MNDKIYPRQDLYIIILQSFLKGITASYPVFFDHPYLGKLIVAVVGLFVTYDVSRICRHEIGKRFFGYWLCIYIFSFTGGFCLGGAGMIITFGKYENYQDTFWLALLSALFFVFGLYGMVRTMKKAWYCYVQVKKDDKTVENRIRRKSTKKLGKKFGKQIGESYRYMTLERDYSKFEIILFYYLELIYDKVDLIKNKIKVLILDDFIFKMLDKIFFNK